MKNKKFRFRKKRNKIKVLILIIAVVSILVLNIITRVSKQINRSLIIYAKTEAQKITSLIIYQSIDEEFASFEGMDDLVMVEKDLQGKIVGVEYNSILVNQLLTKVTRNIHENLKNFEEGNIDEIDFINDLPDKYDRDKFKSGIIYELPVGIIANNSLLGNVGPNIPVRLKIVGSVESNVVANVKDYGINNAMIELKLCIDVKTRVILPMISEELNMDTEVLIAVKIINGEVPRYYVNSQNRSDTFSIPVE